MASTKEKSGEHARNYSIGDLTLDTLDAISDVEHSRNGEHPFKGYTAEALQKITINGKPAYIDIVTDPDTGDVIDAKQTDEAKKSIAEAEAQLEDMAEKLMAAIPPETTEKIKKTARMLWETVEKTTALFNQFNTKEWRDTLEKWSEAAQPAIDLIHEVQELDPYIRAELEKPEYNGVTFDELMDYTPGELLDLLADPNSVFARVMTAARAARAKREEELNAQQAGRAARRETKENAKQTNAIMEIRGGNYSIFSQTTLWNAFTPGRIVKMGEPIKKYIDEKTGRVKKMQFEPGDIETIKDPAEISLQAYLLLNSIIENAIGDPRKNPIEQKDFFKNDGKLKFYVKGVIDAIKNDPRTLIKMQDDTDSQQLDINRKTAGAIYLEQLFEPLQGYIGTTSNGSRWSVFNYVGYDAETDTMTVQTPYLYQLWHETQAPYFIRQKNKEAQQLAGKKPKRADEKPLELNNLFKGAAYNEDETIMEIAVYITNVLLTAGNNGKPKTTRIKYNTIISNCPRLKSRIDNLQELPAKYTDENGKEHTRNKSALYNTELRKIARAFDIIQNPDKCDARTQYEFIDITPAKKNKKTGAFELTPPTKSMLQDQIIIKWRRIKDDENPQ